MAARGSDVLLWLGLPLAVLGGDTLLWARGRELTGEKCSPALLDILQLPGLEWYENCVRSRMMTTNLTVVGADVWVKASCWCESNAQAELEQFKCCDHPNYRGLCQLQCNATCSSPEAKSCLSTCPAMCLEEDYAMSACKCAEANCFQYALCITEQGRNRTHAGELPQVCDDYAFRRSDELRDYFLCMQDQPKRTNWNRHHSASYCSCKSNLQAALSRHHCCSTSWGLPTCKTSCMDAKQCAQAQGANCLQDCSRKCSMVTPNRVTTDCYDHCFRNNSPCSAYQTCRPVAPPAHDYICTTGQKPLTNGCCRQQYFSNGRPVAREDCPILCARGQKYDLPHGPECQCLGCPKTPADVRRELKGRVAQEALESGQLLLASIASRAGLAMGPTGNMQELMNQRNRVLREVVDQHTGDLASLEQALRDLSADWNGRILAEALKAKICENNWEKCQRDAFGLRRRRDEDASSFFGLTLGLLFGIFTMGLVVGVFFYIVRRRKASSGQADAEAGGPSPLAGDSNVVVGRPIQEGNGTGAAEGATEGAPVGTSGKVA